MRIITVNLPVSYLKAIDSLTGNTGLYPSRSELIRVAVRDFLITEIQAAKEFSKFQQNYIKPAPRAEEIDEILFVRVPIENENGSVEYKTYHLVKKTKEIKNGI